MKSVRFLTLILMFFLDVHVRADGHGHAPVSKHDGHGKHEIHATETCWGHTPCAVKATERLTIMADKFKMTMAPDALANQKDAQNVWLVAGQFYLNVSTGTKFKTPYAEFQCSGVCQALVDRKQDELIWKSVGGAWIFKRTGDQKDYALDSGLQVTIGEVTETGVAQMEVPQSLPWTLTAKDWAELFDGPVEEFKKELTRFREEWSKAVESAAKVQSEIAGRAIASHEREQAALRRQRQAQEREDAHLRKLFREKNNFDN